jgi:hypothetical protein
MRRTFATLFLALAAQTSDGSLIAHHSFAAEYDRNKPVTLTGTVTRLEWMNPHIYFYVDVKDAEGKTTNWAIEGGAPNSLYRAGWRKDSLKVGDVVTVFGHLARDGSHQAHMRTLTLADGRSLFSGQREDAPAGSGSGSPPRR